MNLSFFKLGSIAIGLLMSTSCSWHISKPIGPRLDIAVETVKYHISEIEKIRNEILKSGKKLDNYYLGNIYMYDGFQLFEVSHKDEFGFKTRYAAGNISGQSLWCKIWVEVESQANCYLLR